MKTHLIFIFLILQVSILWSQQINFTGKVSYNMYLVLNRPIEYKAELFFNNNQSLFQYSEIFIENIDSEKVSDDNLNFNLVLRDTLTKEIFMDKSNDSLYEKHINFLSKQSYYSVENVPKLQWDITEEKKNIKDIECYLANTTFRGRQYFVWFAPSLAASVGPWKFTGLPGIILEAYDDQREVVFYANRISIPHAYTNTPLSQELNVVSLDEHLKILHDFDSLISEKIKSKLGRGIHVTVDTKISAIELNYDN